MTYSGNSINSHNFAQVEIIVRYVVFETLRDKSNGTVLIDITVIFSGYFLSFLLLDVLKDHCLVYNKEPE